MLWNINNSLWDMDFEETTEQKDLIVQEGKKQQKYIS